MAPDSKCKSHFHVIAAGFEKLSCCCLGIKAQSTSTDNVIAKSTPKPDQYAFEDDDDDVDDYVN